MTVQEELYNLIKGMDSAEAVRANIPRIIDRWTPDVSLDITAKEALEGIYATQHLDGIKYAMQGELRTVTLLLAKRWTEVAEWTTDAFWKNLDDIHQHYPDARTDFYSMMAAQIVDFVTANQTAIEAMYFNDPLYQHKLNSWHTVKTDYSNYYREMTNILIDQGRVCPWSNDFIRSLYKGEKRISDQVTWIEFEHLPDLLKWEFALDGISSHVLHETYITQSWIEDKSSTEEQQIWLTIAAAANGYVHAEEMLQNTEPEIAKYIRIAQELELPASDIIASALKARHLNVDIERLGTDISFD